MDEIEKLRLMILRLLYLDILFIRKNKEKYIIPFSIVFYLPLGVIKKQFLFFSIKIFI